ncbi:LysR family transcriptional regulator [Caballeronia sp. J97]|uniref:LysR family transcriptional regulator n=1 Tax=Caballeronia sp. J97 TaxID=2805429 RepID=UPI002AB0F91A|nr:LysR substrate-binding domain-containing protein [Caballeronia sp. J97]
MERLPDVKITQLRHFVAVIEHRSFKAAAAAVFRSQPALSLSIKELESALGAPLFEKGSHASPTPFGAMLYGEARKLVEHYERVIVSAVDVVRARHGRVRVAAVPSIAHEMLPRAISRYALRHPGIELHVEDGTAAYIYDRVRSGAIDFGIAGEPEGEPELNFTPLLSDVMCVVVKAGHPLFRHRKIKWKDLSGYQLIGNGTMRGLPGALLDAIGKPDIFIANTTALLSAVEGDVGLTVLPYLAQQRHRETLRFIPLDEPHVERKLGFVEPIGRSLSPAALALRETFLENLDASTLPKQVRRVKFE